MLMLIALLLLLVSAILIYISCNFFVNGIEWLGHRLNLGTTAVGSVLAAFGTALPECAVTFSAVVYGKTTELKQLGVGAAMGGPLVLATLAYALVGLSLYLHRRKTKQNNPSPQIDTQKITQDQIYFLAIFMVKVSLGLLAFHYKPWLGLLFILAYACYVLKEIRAEVAEDQELTLEPFKFQSNSAQPKFVLIWLQVILALAVIAFASHTFVTQLEVVGIFLNLSPALVALLFSPIATELPEIMNAVIWLRQGKVDLALANISGSMMIQATLPSALGLIFTPWLFDGPLLSSGLLTIAAILFALWVFKRKNLQPQLLICSAGFYGMFIFLFISYFKI